MSADPTTIDLLSTPPQSTSLIRNSGRVAA